MSIQKTIAIDLRGLNYPYLTGINTYTLHFLWCLWNIVSVKPDYYRIIGIGLSVARRNVLSEKFPFFNQLFSQHISLRQYLPTIFTRSRSLANGLFSLQQTYGFNLTNSACFQPDILIQTQPKALPRHPLTSRLLVFHDVFGILFPEFSSWKQHLIENRGIYKNLACDAGIIFANSFATACDIQRLAPSASEEIQWVYPALPCWHFLSDNVSTQPISTPLNHSSYFLVLSGAEARKNWHTIVKAFAEFCLKYPLLLEQKNIQLVFAGPQVSPSYLKSVRLLVARLKLKNVIFMGEIDEFQKSTLLKNALALVYPSLYEGFGFPILEAFAVQTPVITSSVGSMPEIANSAALLVHPLNIQELCEAMAIAAEGGEGIQAQIQKGTNRAGQFSWGELQRKMQIAIS